MDRLFDLEGEPRVSIFSNKVILGILHTLDAIVSSPEICLELSDRKVELTEKCLFAYNI